MCLSSGGGEGTTALSWRPPLLVARSQLDGRTVTQRQTAKKLLEMTTYGPVRGLFNKLRRMDGEDRLEGASRRVPEAVLCTGSAIACPPRLGKATVIAQRPRVDLHRSRGTNTALARALGGSKARPPSSRTVWRGWRFFFPATKKERGQIRRWYCSRVSIGYELRGRAAEEAG